MQRKAKSAEAERSVDHARSGAAQSAGIKSGRPQGRPTWMWVACQGDGIDWHVGVSPMRGAKADDYRT